MDASITRSMVIPAEPLGAIGLGISQRRLAAHELREQQAADRAERQAKMLVAEIEPQALVARRRADDRQHVGQAGAPAEPELGVAPLGEREEIACERLQPVEMRRRGRIVAAREFRAGRQADAARHRRQDIAEFEIENRAAERRIALGAEMHVIAALDAEGKAIAERLEKV